ncbi:MAG: fibronectin type III domain-containing protein [Bacteroidales bacterium]
MNNGKFNLARRGLRTIFVALLYLLISPIWSQTTITIGSGSSTTANFPITAYFGYSYTQQIYLQSEINTAGDITKLRFYKSSTGTVTNSSSWVIYMGHTTKTAFTSTSDWIPVSALTQVYSGTVTFPNSGWMEITLTTPFNYNNIDNLAIAVDENTSGYNSSNIYWYSFAPGGNRGIYYRSDVTNPDPNSPPTATGTSSSINQIQLDITPPSNMSITSSTTYQIDDPVLQGDNDAAILATQIITDGTQNPLTVSSITFTTTGTTNTSDITSAKVYYTTTPTFSTAAPFGSAIPNPSGTLTFTGTQQLAIGSGNYFWLAYDVAPGATLYNLLDGTCEQFTTTEPQTYTPTTTNPAGSRTIRAPLAGTYTIDNTNPTNVNSGGTNYNNFEDALDDLNTLGHSAAVTFNVYAGQTFNKIIPTGSTYAYYIMDYIGSSAAPVTFQKFGPGANPALNITGTSSTADIGMYLYGCDYVTFDGIDILDAGSSSSDYLERGYYLQGPTDDNCDHVTIQNCTIDLNKNNTNSRGIYAVSNGPSSTANANNNNTITNNTIQDAYNGIYFSGNSSYYDQNNSITNNSIHDLGANSLTSTVYGIYSSYQNNLTANNNTIYDLTSNSTIYGFYTYYNNGTCTFNNNNVYNLTGASTSSPVYGMYFYPNPAASTTINANNIYSMTNNYSIYGLYIGNGNQNNITNNKISSITYVGSSSYIAYGLSSSGGTNNNIYNNFIAGIAAPSSTTNPGVRALNLNGGTTANVYHNSVYVGYTSFVSSNQSASLYVTTSPTTLYMQNNIFVNNTDVTTGTRAVAFYKSSNSLTNLANSNNNNLYYAGSPGTKNLIYYDGTNSIQDLAAFKTFMNPRESQSVTENPPFTSTIHPYDLHLSGTTQAESGGSSTTGVSDDIDGDIRQGFTGYAGTGIAPDIGADEFEGTNPNISSLDMGATALVNPPSSGCYGASETVTVTIKNYGTSTIDFSVNPVTVTTNVTGAGTQTLTGTVNSGTLAPGATTNVNMSSTLDMTTTGTYTFDAYTTVSGDGNASNDYMPPAPRIVAPLAPIPYTEDFEDGTAQNWTTTGWYIGTNHANPASGKGLYKNIWSSAPSGIFTTGKIGPVNATDYLYFDYRIVDYTGYPGTATPNTPAWGSIAIDVSTDCGVSYSPFATIDPSNHISTTDWTTKSYALSSFAGQTVIFRFTATWLAGDYYVDFDNFIVQTPPSCPAPSALTASNITTNSADLGWTENGSATTWDIEYGLQGFTQGTGTTISGVTSNPYTLTGLAANSAYDFYVRADCGSGNYSTWIGPQSFTTLCNPSSIPFTENFTSNSFPMCWSQTYSGGVTSNRWSVSNTTNAGGTANEMQATYVNATGTSRLITPALNTTGLTSIDLSFKTFFDDYGPGVTGKIQTSTDLNTWTDVPGWSITSGGGDVGPTTVNMTINQDLNSPTTYIAWTLVGDHYQFDYWYVDDVSIIETPSCPAPSALTASNVTTNSTDLGWTENGSATTWDIEYGPQGFTQGTGTTISGVTSNPYTLTGLIANTAYGFYVRANCGGGDYSTWAGPQSFTTPPSCPAPSALTTSNITANSAQLGWTENGSATTWDIEYGPQGFTQGTGTTISGVTSNPYTLTGLSPTTTYSFYVRSDCGGGNYSTWTGPQSFTTSQVPATLPYTQTFEDGTGADLTFVNGTQTNKWYVGSATQNGGTYSAYISNDGGTSNAYTITTSSVVHFLRDITFTPGADGYILTFDWKGMGEGNFDFLKVYLVETSTQPVAGTQLTSGQIGSTQYNNSSTWQTATIHLPASLAGTTKRLVFSWRNDFSVGTQPPAAVDNISLSAIYLPTVTTTSLSNITSTSATGGGNVTSDGGATVTARGVCWNTSPNPTLANNFTTDGSGTGSFTSSLTGLSPNTTYYVRAYATNAAGTAYGNEVSFTTHSNVTFNVDVSTINGFIHGTDNIYLSGSFPGAVWVEPGTDPNFLMSRVGTTDIYTLTLSLPNGAYDYKYFRNSGWSGGEWSVLTNRSITVNGNTSTNDVFGGNITWANLQWPGSGSVAEGGTFNVYGQAFIPNGITAATGATYGLEAWVGVSTTNTDPSTWSNWIPATFNTQSGNNDEFMANIATGLTPGTYYYAFRYRFGQTYGTYLYGGYSSGGGGFWDGTTYVNGVLNVTSASKTLDVTVFMEGPFNGTDMNTDLLSSSLLPTSQPYNVAPWNYAGTESVVSFPANVVDWVLVELRDADVPANATPATTLSGWPKAMFLRNDGQIVDLNGNLPNIGNPTVNNNLFVVVRHRNHLDVMSNTGAVLSGNTYSYDFSTGINQAYGGSAGYKQLSASIYGMVAGDGDADGSILSSDFNAWAGDFGNSGYYITDLDSDGQVFSSDFNRWAGNFGFNYPIMGVQPVIYRTQVPSNK